MATQRVTVAKLGGVCAREVLSLLRRWRKDEGEDGLIRNRKASSEVVRFLETLRENAFFSPILFFREYVDPWLLGDKLQPPLGIPRLTVRVFRPSLSLHVVRLGPRTIQALREAIARLSRSTAWRQFPEGAWFLQSLRDAVELFRGVVRPQLLLVARRVATASDSDDGVRERARTTPAWFRFPTADPRSRRRT